MKVIYNDVDITNSVSVTGCVLDMYAGDGFDTLQITMNDMSQQWDRWSPLAGDKIRIKHGQFDSGNMIISKLLPTNGRYIIKATSAPLTAKDPRGKAWVDIKLLQIGQEIAARHGLEFKSYGVADFRYKYLLQANENDFAFYSHLCTVEGCGMIVQNGALVVYDIATIEATEPTATIEVTGGSEYRYSDRTGQMYTDCKIELGRYSGGYSTGLIPVRKLSPPLWVQAASDEECARFSRNLLRDANKDAQSGHFKADIQPGLAAGSVIRIKTSGAASWDGAVFLHHVRNDFVSGKSKLFFRRPLGVQ